MLRRTIALFLPILALGTPAAGQTGFAATQTELASFARADADADGVLTLAEFRVFVQGMAAAGQPTARQIRRLRVYRIAFAITDANRDGVVSPAELRAADDRHRAGKGPYKPDW